MQFGPVSVTLSMGASAGRASLAGLLTPPHAAMRRHATSDLIAAIIVDSRGEPRRADLHREPRHDAAFRVHTARGKRCSQFACHSACRSVSTPRGGRVMRRISLICAILGAGASLAWAGVMTVGTSKDACDGDDVVKFQTRNGPAKVKNDQHDHRFDMMGMVHEFQWYCGGSRERVANDKPFNVV